MTLRISAIFLLPSLFIGPVLRAQSVFHDSHAPQVSFASAEIGRALGPQRATPDRGMRDLTSDNSSLRFAIAAGADESKALAQTLRVAPLKTTAPQSYAIRRTEISVQNYAIHAIITAFEKIVVHRAQLVWHVSERNRSAPLPQLLTRSCPTGAIFSEHTLRKNVDLD